MDEKTEMLLYGQHYRKFQKAAYGLITDRYQITFLELRVLMFLAEHEQNDTAKDIEEIHHFTKSSVSKSIDALLEKGYLARNPDRHDRRCVHLQILPEAYPVIEAARQRKKEIMEIVFSGITEEELQIISGIAQKISSNMAAALETGFARQAQH